MTVFEDFLVVLDPTSKEQPALERATWLAERTGAALELFICAYEPDFEAPGVFDPLALERARRNLLATHVRTLREHARRLERRGFDVRVDARWHHPRAAGIVAKAIDSNAGLVFKDTHYHDALRRALFSNTDWDLIRCCPAPLWLVKPRPMGETPSIVAAVDPLHAHGEPGSLDDRILSIGETLTGAVGGSLHAFHSYDVAPALAVSGDSTMMPISVSMREVADELRRAHEEAVFALTDRHALDRDHVAIQEGATRRLIVAMAEQSHADLVVIGAVARNALRRLFIGSTAEQVLDKLPCDVLIVKPAEAALATV